MSNQTLHDKLDILDANISTLLDVLTNNDTENSLDSIIQSYATQYVSEVPVNVSSDHIVKDFIMVTRENLQQNRSKFFYLEFNIGDIIIDFISNDREPMVLKNLSSQIEEKYAGQTKLYKIGRGLNSNQSMFYDDGTCTIIAEDELRDFDYDDGSILYEECIACYEGTRIFEFTWLDTFSQTGAFRTNTGDDDVTLNDGTRTFNFLWRDDLIRDPVEPNPGNVDVTIPEGDRRFHVFIKYDSVLYEDKDKENLVLTTYSDNNRPFHVRIRDFYPVEKIETERGTTELSHDSVHLMGIRSFNVYITEPRKVDPVIPIPKTPWNPPEAKPKPKPHPPIVKPDEFISVPIQAKSDLSIIIDCDTSNGYLEFNSNGNPLTIELPEIRKVCNTSMFDHQITTDGYLVFNFTECDNTALNVGRVRPDAATHGLSTLFFENTNGVLSAMVTKEPGIYTADVAKSIEIGDLTVPSIVKAEVEDNGYLTFESSDGMVMNTSAKINAAANGRSFPGLYAKLEDMGGVRNPTGNVQLMISTTSDYKNIIFDDVVQKRSDVSIAHTTDDNLSITVAENTPVDIQVDMPTDLADVTDIEYTDNKVVYELGYFDVSRTDLTYFPVSSIGTSLLDETKYVRFVNTNNTEFNIEIDLIPQTPITGNMIAEVNTLSDVSSVPVGIEVITGEFRKVIDNTSVKVTGIEAIDIDPILTTLTIKDQFNNAIDFTRKYTETYSNPESVYYLNGMEEEQVTNIFKDMDGLHVELSKHGIPRVMDLGQIDTRYIESVSITESPDHAPHTGYRLLNFNDNLNGVETVLYKVDGSAKPIIIDLGYNEDTDRMFAKLDNTPVGSATNSHFFYDVPDFNGVPSAWPVSVKRHSNYVDVLRVDLSDSTYSNHTFSDYDGVLSEYPTDITLTDNGFNVSWRKAIDSIVPNSTMLATQSNFFDEMHVVDGVVSIKGYHSGTWNTIGTIPNLNPTPAKFVDTITLLNDIITVTYSDTTDTSLPFTNYHGEDAKYLTSVDTNTLVYSDTTDKLLPFATKHGAAVNSVEYMKIETGNLVYKLNDQVETVGETFKIGGTDKETITNITNNGTLKIYFSTSTHEDLGKVDGNDFAYQVDNILFDDKITQVTTTATTTFDTIINKSITNITKVGSDLHTAKNYAIFNDNIGRIDGMDYPDGKWITNFNIVDKKLYATYSDTTTEYISVFDRSDISTVTLINDVLSITFDDATNFSFTGITGTDYAKTLISPYHYVNTLGNLVLVYDTGEEELGRVVGNKSVNDLTSMSITNYKLTGTLNSTTLIDDNVDVKWNFGFNFYDAFSSYNTNDTVVRQNTLYVSNANANTEVPDKNADVDNWKYVLTRDDITIIALPPELIYPVGTDVTTDKIEFEVSEVRSIYTGFTSAKRQIQVIEQGGSFTTPLIDIVFSGTSTLSTYSFLANKTYQWRAREIIDHLSFTSAWSSLSVFTTSTYNSIPDIMLPTNQLLFEVSFASSIILNEGDELVVNFRNKETNNVKHIARDNFNSFTIPLGLLKEQDQYDVYYSIKTPTTLYTSNIVAITPTQFDASLFNPIISYKGRGNLFSTDRSPMFVLTNIRDEYYQDSVLGNNFKAQWQLLDGSNAVIKTFTNKVDLESIIISENLASGSSRNIRYRLVDERNNINSPWSNTLQFIPAWVEPSISLLSETVVLPIDFNVTAAISGTVYNFTGIGSEWEINDSSGTLIKRVINFTDIFSLDYRIAPMYMGTNITIRCRLLSSNNIYTEWTSKSFTVEAPRDIIAPPIITGYFEVEYQPSMLNGTQIDSPTQIEFSTRTDTIGHKAFIFDVIDETLFQVKYTEFDNHTLYYLKARVFHTTLGWSEWSSEEQIGYSLYTDIGDYDFVPPENVERISAVGIGGGGGGCGASILNHTGGGGSLRYLSNIDTSLFTTLPLSVGKGGGWHINGEDTKIGSYIVATGGGWDSNGGVGGEAEVILQGTCDVAYGGGDGGIGQYYGAGGAGGYDSNGGNGEDKNNTAILPELSDAGAGGIQTVNRGKGGSTGLLGIAFSNTHSSGDHGSQPYLEVPVSGGGGGLDKNELYYTGANGGVCILYGICRYPEGLVKAWNK